MRDNQAEESRSLVLGPSRAVARPAGGLVARGLLLTGSRTVRLEFPSTSMGSVYVRDRFRPLNENIGYGERSLGEARGQMIVELGPDEEIFLLIVSADSLNLTPLMNMDPDAIYVLALDRYPGGGAIEALKALRSWKRLEGLELENSEVGTPELRVTRELAKLRHLKLHTCSVTDDDLVFLPMQLEMLWLLNANISDAGLNALSRMPLLRRVTLCDTEVTDHGIQELPEDIEELSLSGTLVGNTGLLCLRNFRNLKSLDLRSCPGIDESVFPNIPNTLKSLDLGYCDQFRGEVLRNLPPRLEELVLEGTDVSVPETLDQLPTTLVTLSVNSNKTVRDSHLHHLLRLPKLRYLILSGCPVTDDGMVHLAALPSLVDLALSGTRITDKSLSILSHAPALRHIFAHRDSFSATAIQRFQRSRPDITLDLFRL
jgi:Leucine-rich repeat (LRR) protein